MDSKIAYRSLSSSPKYIFYLIVVACAGWALASYDVNLLVLALPEIAQNLGISEYELGILGFVVYGAQFIVTLFVGYGMDRYGRKRMWMICMSGTAIFTGMTCLVHNFWELATVRALASGLAYSELAVSITIVNEQLPARNRGLLYSIVQGGWPLGVFLASGVYLIFDRMGWRFVFLLGVLPILAVMLGRVFIKESERFEEEKIRQSIEGTKPTLRELFLMPGDIRRQLVILSIGWISYGASYVATNFYITYWLTEHKNFTSHQASFLMLLSGGAGFFFYVGGGWLGERIGRKTVIVLSATLVAPLSLIFLYAQAYWLIVLDYFFLYQITNGVWSAAGYAYQSESFPTRIRGTAVGFLAAMLVLGFVSGSVLWTAVAGQHNPTLTWVVVAVLGSLGMLVTALLRPISPGQELEAIVS
ncbi:MULTISPECIES: MFS transporter [Gluconobacter]|uniref:MFS transporter n=1 Tax=Gluconobacter TaxID=441 RepID=UPI001C04013E|nr:MULTISPECIES: MFS transporter [Gluconobacter]